MEIDGSQSKITIKSSIFRFMAYDLFAFYINSLNEINTRRKEIMSAFSKGLISVCEGQALDKEYELKQSIKIIYER